MSDSIIIFSKDTKKMSTTNDMLNVIKQELQSKVFTYWDKYNNDYVRNNGVPWFGHYVNHEENDNIDEVVGYESDEDYDSDEEYNFSEKDNVAISKWFRYIHNKIDNRNLKISGASKEFNDWLNDC